MESVDRMNPEVARLFTAKQERRRQLAAPILRNPQLEDPA